MSLISTFRYRYGEREGSGRRSFHGKNVGREETLVCHDKTCKVNIHLEKGTLGLKNKLAITKITNLVAV